MTEKRNMHQPEIVDVRETIVTVEAQDKAVASASNISSASETQQPAYNPPAWRDRLPKVTTHQPITLLHGETDSLR